MTLLGAAAPVAIVAPTALSWCLTNPVACNQLAITGGEIIAGDAVGTAGLGVAGMAGVKAVKAATEVNAAMTAAGRTAAWQNGTPVFDVLLQPGTKVQMVVDKKTAEAIRDGDPYNLGGWATFDDIKSTATDMRQRLAISDKFQSKTPADGPFYVIELEIKKPVQTNIGFVGAQTNENGTWLRGGGTQAEFYSLLTQAQRQEYLQVVGKPKPLVR